MSRPSNSIFQPRNYTWNFDLNWQPNQNEIFQVILFFVHKSAEQIEDYQEEATCQQVARSYGIPVTSVTARDFPCPVKLTSMISRNSRALYSTRTNCSFYESGGYLEVSFMPKLIKLL
jgi:hypothetical protein